MKEVHLDYSYTNDGEVQDTGVERIASQCIQDVYGAPERFDCHAEVEDWVYNAFYESLEAEDYNPLSGLKLEVVSNDL